MLRYTGKGAAPSGHVQKIRSVRRAKILDESSPKMILVESSAADLASLMENLPGWTIGPEQTTKIPDPRPKPRHRPASV